MLKQKSLLEVKKNERLYQFYCDCDSPLGELHDALAEIKQYVVQRIVDAEKTTEVKEPEVVIPE